MRRGIAIAAVLLLLVILALVATRPGSPAPRPPERPGGRDAEELLRTGPPESGPPPAPGDPAETAPEEFDPRMVPWTNVAGRSGTVPEEVRGRGSCSLLLRLVDRRTSAPVGQRIVLWRLGVEDSTGWSRGDQVEREVRVPLDGTLLRKLVPGRYRVEVPGRRVGADDPPAFIVEGETTVRELRLDLPGEFRVRLHLFDGTGAPIRHATFEIEELNLVERSLHRPPGWATPRKRAGFRHILADASEERRSRGAPEEKELSCGPEGFDLGPLAEPGEHTLQSRRVFVYAGERSQVICQLTSGLAKDPNLIGVAVATDRLVEDARLPDGTAVGEVKPLIRASCRAMPVGRRRPEDIWGEVPVSVVVEVEGYALLHFAWKGKLRGRTDLTLKRWGQ